jgi:hypothetical protein
VVVATAIAVSFLRVWAPAASPEPQRVPELRRKPSFRVEPVPAYAQAQLAGGCQEAGIGVVINCGGSAGSPS